MATLRPGAARANYQGIGESTPLVLNSAPPAGVGGKPDLIGVNGFETASEVARSALINRYWLIGVTVVLSLVVIVAAVAGGYAITNRTVHIRRESQTNDRQSATIEFYNWFGGNEYDQCSGVFVGSTGQFLTASHCLSDPNVCDFDTDNQRYLIDSLFYVDVMGINGTSEKRTFDAQIIGWSGLSDVAILQALPTAPFSPTDTPVDISIVDQEYFGFGDSGALERGELVTGMSFDESFLKKLTHVGAVQAVHKDRSFQFATSVEQVFYDGNLRDGASGSGVFNKDGQLVIAPITFSWHDELTASGTSSRVSGPLTRRFLNPLTPPNGPATSYNKYLIPTMGFVSDSSVGWEEFIDFDGDNEYIGFTQNKGVWMEFLYDQDFYEFLTIAIYDCGFDPYTVEPPSLLDAPLDETRYGTPPATFPADPTGGDGNVFVIFAAIERELDENNWIEVGEDAGLETISGVLLSTGKWVGDVVRVLVRAFDPFDTDVTKNWEAVYRVTLRAVDPFWDVPANGDFLSMTQTIHVAETPSATPGKSPTRTFYIDPRVNLPKRLKNSYHHHNATSARTRTVTFKRKGGRVVVREVPTSLANRFSPIPAGLDIRTLPTLAEAFRAHKKGVNPSTFVEKRLAAKARKLSKSAIEHRAHPALDRSKMHAPPPKRKQPHHTTVAKELNPNHHNKPVVRHAKPANWGHRKHLVKK